MAVTTKWSELSEGKRRAITVAAIVEAALLGAALLDIRRRPAEQIRGPKQLWTPLAFVSFAGPIAYFAFGRRRVAA